MGLTPSHLWQNDIHTHRHLSAFAIVLDVYMLIIEALAPGVTGVAEATCLIDFAVATEGLIVVSTDLTTRIDLLVAKLHANALGRAFLRALKSKTFHFPFYSYLKKGTKCLLRI